MTFIIKELYDFITAKTVDDLPLFKLREILKRMEERKEKIDYMKKFIRK